MDLVELKSLLESFGLAEVNMRLFLVIFGVIILAAFAIWMYLRPKSWGGKQYLSHRREWMIQQKKP